MANIIDKADAKVNSNSDLRSWQISLSVSLNSHVDKSKNQRTLLAFLVILWLTYCIISENVYFYIVNSLYWVSQYSEFETQLIMHQHSQDFNILNTRNNLSLPHLRNNIDGMSWSCQRDHGVSVLVQILSSPWIFIISAVTSSSLLQSLRRVQLVCGKKMKSQNLAFWLGNPSCVSF